MALFSNRAIGRILFSLIFIVSAIRKIQHWKPTLEFAANTLDQNGFDFDRLIGGDFLGQIPLMLGVVVALELAGGLLLILGQERIATAILVTFLILVTPLMHYPFQPDGSYKQSEELSLLRNAALIGAMMVMRSTMVTAKEKYE